MVLASLTKRVSVLSGGDRGLGGSRSCERGTVPPSCIASALLLPFRVPPKYPLVLLMSHSGDGDGGNQWVWTARAHYMTAGH